VVDIGSHTIPTPAANPQAEGGLVRAHGGLEAVGAGMCVVADRGTLAANGLIVLPDAFTASHLKQIIELAARYRLPAIYANRDYADEGGLMTYGSDPVDAYRRVASYVSIKF
jgi:putative ABC transport system substrate-binding protein